jgi:actin-related protein
VKQTAKQKDGDRKEEVHKTKDKSKHKTKIEEEAENQEVKKSKNKKKEENREVKKSKNKKKEENEENEENEEKKDKQGRFVELGAQWIHGRGENPLWLFCIKNSLRILQVGVSKHVHTLH